MKQTQYKKPAAQKDLDDIFELDDVGNGDEFMAVKPWLG
jgi:hypothetical protein